MDLCSREWRPGIRTVDGRAPPKSLNIFYQEILPAAGVRVNKFVQLSDDIARVMEAQSVRVLAPIPGSNHVGDNMYIFHASLKILALQANGDLFMSYNMD